MSDLAPFVAAVLRDKSNADFMEENDSQRLVIDSLRGQLRNIRAVKITGANGSPVFKCAQLEDGFVSRDDLNLYLLLFRDPQDDDDNDDDDFIADTFSAVYPLRDLLDTAPEIHVGGYGGHIETMSGPFEKGQYDQDDRYGVWHYYSANESSSALQVVMFRIGPFTSEAEFDGFDLNDDRTMNPHDTNSNGESINVSFCIAAFDCYAISGLIDDFGHKLQQGQQEMFAAADAAAAQVAAARPPANVDDNDNH